MSRATGRQRPESNVAAAGNGAASADERDWLPALRKMLAIRMFEERVNDLYKSARMPGLAHLYSGQEAVAVGVCEALSPDDYITSTHRGHGHCLAKGATPERMFAELLGKKPGYCGGKGGSMHIADPATSNLGANAIVGGSAGIATGAAFSCKRFKNGRIAVCFFGEGALGQGLLYEEINLASLWALPVLFLCENNLYSEYTPYRETLAGSIAGRAEAFGLRFQEVDGQNVRDVFDATSLHAAHAREGGGPAFLLFDTYRYYGHHVGDIDRAYYRSREEEQEWTGHRDPIRLLSDWLIEQGRIVASDIEALRREIQAEIDGGVESALSAPYPAASEVDSDVYA